MAVTLRIGTLVVEGMDGQDAQALAAALTQALRTRLAAGPPPALPARVDVPHASSPHAMGRGIAAALVPGRIPSGRKP